MEHQLFKPKALQEGKHAVVGNCNGIPMEERYEKAIEVGKIAVSLSEMACGINDTDELKEIVWDSERRFQQQNSQLQIEFKKKG